MKKAPIVIFGILAIVALVYRARLTAWFRGDEAGGAWSAPVSTQVGDWTIEVAMQPDPPRESGDRVRIRINGGTLDGATVSAAYDMAAMGSMPEMKGSFTAAPAGDAYVTPRFDLPMGGTWSLIVDVAAAGRSATARFTFTVGASGITVVGGDAAPGVVEVDADRRDAVGIATTPVVRAPMSLDLHAVGRLTYDERRLTDVTLKVGGYVTDLRVAATGGSVSRGEVLFTLYSPDLYAAEQEYLIAKNGKQEGLAAAAAKKLSLLGVSDKQLAAITAQNAPIEHLPFTSPASGSIIEKDVVEGDAVSAGQRLFRIAALDRVWVEADVYEADLARITKGQAATITLGYLPGRSFAGKVTFIYPYLDPATRTARVRVELPNADLALKPDMFADVSFHVDLGPRLQVPVSSVIYTGPQRIVFVDQGGGQLARREVTIGARAGDLVEIVTGVAEGEQVVSAGNFLVASEARLREAAP